MSTICCLTVPLNPPPLSSSVLPNDEPSKKEKKHSTMLLNDYLPSMTYSNHMPMSTRSSPSQHHQLVFLAEDTELVDFDHQSENDKLLLPRSTRSLKRRTSLLEKSRDWARRLITLHRTRRTTLSNEKLCSPSQEFNRFVLTRNNSYQQSLHQYQKSLDEDGYLSPMEIKAKLDNITQEKQTQPSSTNPQQVLVYSHSSTDIAHPFYRCHGPMMSTSMCTCPYPQLPSTAPAVGDYHKSLSVVDYIDYDVTDEPLASAQVRDDTHDDEDPLTCLKYLFHERDEPPAPTQPPESFPRRVPRRSTNTSSISTDSGYCDIPMASSKLIPVHLISCTLIPVNVTRTDPTNIRCLPCACLPSPSTAAQSHYLTSTSERRRRKSSTHSARSHLNRMISGQPMELIDHSCSCPNKYYSTMTICPALPLPSSTATKSDSSKQHSERRYSKHKRPQLLRLPSAPDHLTAVSRWYRPHLERDAVYHALQQADYGAFILRNSTTHADCYALSVKVPKFTHDTNIAHYLIERLPDREGYLYRIKGTMKQFPTLLSLLTHHSVMPEILPITLNLHETLSI